MSEHRGFRLGAFLRAYWPYGLGIGAAFGLLNFTYYYLDDVTRGVDKPILEPFIEEMTASYGVALLLPLIVWVAFRFRLDRPGRFRRLAAHLPALVLFSLAHSFWNWGTRLVLFPLAGLGAYDYGAMPVRLFMEFPSDVIVYGLTLALAYLIGHYREAQAQRVTFSRLETRLARAQLDNLRAQLQPHFLFNTLNTVSSVMYDDPAAADAVLARLSELLRRTMDGGVAAQEVPLGRELEALEMYVDIMRARFGERLVVRLEIEPEARLALVPSLLLQPLVENALRHGEPAPPAPAQISISATREGDWVTIDIIDNGPGFGDPEAARSGDGVGLPNTIARLDQLYGAAASLELDNPLGGGARVRVRLPFTNDESLGPAGASSTLAAAPEGV
jgi:signal transduction histidine kinase